MSAKLRQSTIDAVSRLANTAVAEATRQLAAGPKRPIMTLVREFVERNWLLFRSELGLLLGDPSLSNRSQSEIQQELLALIDAIFRNSATYADPTMLDQRISQLTVNLQRESEHFEAALGIESITLPDGQIVIGRTTVEYFDEARVRSWGLNLESELGLGNQMVGRTVGLVRVYAGSHDRAWELAIPEVDTSLQIMRAAMVSSHDAPRSKNCFSSGAVPSTPRKDCPTQRSSILAFARGLAVSIWISAESSRTKARL